MKGCMTMTFKKKFNIPDDVTHEEKYRIIIDGLGYDDVKRFLPVTFGTEPQVFSWFSQLQNVWSLLSQEPD